MEHHNASHITKSITVKEGGLDGEVFAKALHNASTRASRRATIPACREICYDAMQYRRDSYITGIENGQQIIERTWARVDGT